MTIWQPARPGLLRRRTLLQGMAGLAALAAAGRPARAQEMPTLVNSIRSLSNPYHATWNQGGEAFAAAIGAPVVVAVSAPTTLAVETARAAGLTLIAVARADGFEVFTGAERLAWPG